MPMSVRSGLVSFISIIKTMNVQRVAATLRAQTDFVEVMLKSPDGPRRSRWAETAERVSPAAERHSAPPLTATGGHTSRAGYPTRRT